MFAVLLNILHFIRKKIAAVSSSPAGWLIVLLICVAFLFAFRLEYFAHFQLDCKQPDISVRCTDHYLEKNEVGKIIVALLILVDALLIVRVSYNFSQNYQLIFDKLKLSYGAENAEKYWSEYYLSENAFLAPIVLVLLLPVWFANIWVIYPFLLFLLYFLFAWSNRQLMLLLCSNNPISGKQHHNELFVDILTIAKIENVKSFRGYAFLFIIVAFAHILIMLSGNDNPHNSMIMKSFLAGAATIHLSLSASKFKTLIGEDVSAAVTLLQLSKYEIMQKDYEAIGGTRLPEEIDRKFKFYLPAVLITLLVVLAAFSYKSLAGPYFYLGFFPITALLIVSLFYNRIYRWLRTRPPPQ